MTLTTPFPRSYLRYAFNDQHNLVILAGGACFSAAFADPLPVLVTAAGELAWLLAAPRLPKFRAWVDGRLSAEYLERAERAIEGALSHLPTDDVSRFLALTPKLQALTSSSVRLSARERLLAQHALLELRRTFLDYSFLGQRLAALIEPDLVAQLEAEAARLQDTYRSERELNQRMTIRNAIRVVQNKIDEQVRLYEVARAVELRVQKLEDAPTSLARAEDRGEPLAARVLTSLTGIGSADALEATVAQILEGRGR